MNRSIYKGIGQYPAHSVGTIPIVSGRNIVPDLQTDGANLIRAFELHTTESCEVTVNGHSISTKLAPDLEEYVLIIDQPILRPGIKPVNDRGDGGEGITELKITGSGSFYIQFYF